MADWRTGIAVAAIVTGACGSPDSQVVLDSTAVPDTTAATIPERVTTSAATVSDRLAAAPSTMIEIPDAVAMNLSSNGTGSPMVAWVTDDAVKVASLDLDDGDLDDPLEVNGTVRPFAHHIERPAIAVDSDGRVDIAFTSLHDSGGSVFRVLVGGDGASDPERISGEPEPETNLVHIALGPAGRPAFSWLENSTLSVATLRDGELSESEDVDDLTCDCCNPVPVFAAGRLVVAYRDLAMTDAGTVRNVSAVASDDGGVSFGDVVPVADDDWLIAGCPFTGPSAITLDDRIVVAWMDARQSVHPEQRSSSIWVDASDDGAATFGVDVQVIGEGLNRWPVMAADAQGVVHLVWERRGTDSALYHATSADGGASFSDPRVLVNDAAGPPRTPSIIVHNGLLIATWTTPGGGHVAAWRIEL